MNKIQKMVLQPFRSNIYSDIKKLYILVGKLSPHMQQLCTSLILQASRRAGLNGPLLRRGKSS